MAVARSYESLRQVGEPFEENKRMYIYVITKKGEQKKVRWYTDSQRASQDKAAGRVATVDPMDFNARHAFGFGPDGYITLYKGPNSVIDEWRYGLECGTVRYNLTFQYYSPSKYVIEELPAGITAVKLAWNQVCKDETRMRSHEEIAALVSELIKDENSSAYQGSVNEWLVQDVVVREKLTNQTYFGDKTTHVMIDAGGNVYQWETGAKNYDVGHALKLKMKVKEHKEVKGEKRTIVWYCKEQ